MLGISALSFDLKEKLRYIEQGVKVDYLEYGVDSLDDLVILEQLLNQSPASLSVAFHLPLKTNPVEDIDELRQANQAYLTKIIQEGLHFQPLYFNMHLGHLFQWKYEKNKGQYHRLAADYIHSLLALDPRVHLYMENMYSLDRPKSADLISFGKTVEEIRAVFSLVNSPRVKFCLDMGHAILSGEDFLEEDFVNESLLHFNTNHGNWDEHLGFGVPGYDGNYLKRLKDSGKFKYLLLELSVQEMTKGEAELKRSGLC